MGKAGRVLMQSIDASPTDKENRICH